MSIICKNSEQFVTNLLQENYWIYIYYISSQNKEQIHRRTPTPMFVSNKAAVQLDWKHTLVGCRNGHASTEDTLTWTTAGLASGLHKHFNNEKV